ncbi:isochorismatase family protein [Catenulispora pinisilvae]|uniref:isochorismatase family protein n=1 Tax=Catenulispora pinisilvae TaxID=2705253 RepID=UPI001890D4DB|nr:isochorismatase family protein [Catenulispora pinisilvae]
MALATLDPKTALVLIDLQRGIVAPLAVPYTGTDVVARGKELADAFRAHGLPVVLVNVAFSPDFADAPQGRDDETPGPDSAEGEGAGESDDEGFPADFAVIVDELGAQDGDIRVTKHQWGAFHGTDLDTQLRRRGVTQIVLAGLVTSRGVDTTAREAYAHNYSVAFAVDAMADRGIEVHENAVERIFPQIGQRATTAEVLETLAKTRA